jgi:murein DD-endopeptidase MepM/ murein hydrolase activator NlpD
MNWIFLRLSNRLDKKIQLLIALVLALALSAGPAAAQEQLPIYIVQQGDTLSGIAETFGTSVAALIEVNEIANPSQLFPDQQLLIPGFEGVTGTLETIEVVYGDTLESLAERIGPSVSDLVKLNRITNPMRLYSGQEVIISRPESAEQKPSSTEFYALPGYDQLSISSMLGINSWMIVNDHEQDPRRWVLPGEAINLREGEIREIRALVRSPTLRISLALQGQTLSIQVDTSSESQVAGNLDGKELNFMSSEEGQSVALQGIHALAEPGLQVLELRIGLGNDPESELDISQPIRMFPLDYGSETLRVPAETLDPAVTGPENEIIQAVISQVSSERFWEGSFQFPASYYESFPSFFGTRRSYNGSAFIYYHSGLDLFGSTTTPVLAPAAGRVVFTDSMTVRGNSTYIDHGWGVFSGFLHQSQILVDVGDFVETGQVIGYVGGTGRVTGPHLHWEIWVGGVPVNPLEWTSAVFPEQAGSN